MNGFATFLATIWFGQLPVEHLEDPLALLLMGAIAMAVLVWALSHSSYGESAGNDVDFGSSNVSRNR